MIIPITSLESRITGSDMVRIIRPTAGDLLCDRDATPLAAIGGLPGPGLRPVR